MKWIKRLFLLRRLRRDDRGRGGWWLYRASSSRIAATTSPRCSSTFPAARAGAHRRAAGPAGVVRDPTIFRVALLISGARARSRRGVSLQPADARARRDRQDRARRRLQAAADVSRGLTIAEMAQVFERQGFGKADDFCKAGANAKLIADLDPAAAISKATCFRKPIRCRANTPASWSSSRWWRASRTR
jgi:hypothetical protein